MLGRLQPVPSGIGLMNTLKPFRCFDQNSLPLTLHRERLYVPLSNYYDQVTSGKKDEKTMKYSIKAHSPVRLRGEELLDTPIWNKGTAFDEAGN